MNPAPLDSLRAACAAPLPHPDADHMETLGAEALAWVIKYLSELPERDVGRTASRPEMEALLNRPLREEGMAFSELLSDLTDKVMKFTFRPNHPRFLAFIPAAPTIYSILGELLCAGTNLFAGVWLEAAGPAQVELTVLDWFKEMLGYPRSASGLLTSGGSEANLTALVAARQTLTWEERSHAVLYVGEHRHWSVDRAAHILGLHPTQIVSVASDGVFRLRPDALAEQIARDRAKGLRPWVVVASAGATNSGAIDPLDDLARICQREKLWLHIDAAYGWTAAMTDEGRAALAGIEKADSLTLDPHKWLAQTYEAGCVLVRDGKTMLDAFTLRPEYMQDVLPSSDEVNFCDLGMSLTRRFRALKIWLSLQALGLGWYRRLIDHCCKLADYAEKLLQKSGGFEILSTRTLSIVCFRRCAVSATEQQLDRLNLDLVEALRKTGRAFLSSTRLRGRVALRFCFVNWRTTAADVEEAVDWLKRLSG